MRACYSIVLPLLSLLCGAGAVQYAGTQCVGILDFDLLAAYVPELEATIGGGMTALYSATPWMETSCAVSLRTRACMLAYTTNNVATDSQQYCKTTCEDELAICQKYNKLVGGDPLLQFGLSCDLASDDDATCHTGGESQVEESGPVCPRPLVEPDSSSHDRDAHVEMIEGSACAIPCPNTLSFKESDWDAYNTVTLSSTTVSFVCSLIACVTHFLNKNWNIAYLTAGTTISSFCMMLYFAVNYDYKVTCAGNAGHVEYDPFCMFVGIVLIYFAMWFNAWTLFLALNLYLGIVRGWKKSQLEQLRTKALYFLILTPCLSWVIPLGANNLGYEWTGANVTTCIYMTTTKTEYYFWFCAWAPLFAYMVVTIIFSLSTIYTVTKHTSSMMDFEQHRNDESASAKALRKFWKYNSRQIAFFFIFVCTTVVTLGAWMDAHESSGTRTGDIEDYVACLLSHSTPDSGYARTVCNHPESDDYWKTQLVLCYVGAFGTFPIFVFGTGNFFRNRQKTESRTTKSNNSSTDANSFKRMTVKLFKNFSVSTLKPPPDPVASGAEQELQPAGPVL